MSGRVFGKVLDMFGIFKKKREKKIEREQKINNNACLLFECKLSK